MKTLKSFAAIAAASALALGACSNSSDSEAGSASSEGAAAGSDFKACLVSDAGGWDDKSFNESAYNGLQEAKDEFGIEINTAESGGDSDFGPNTQAMVDDGCNMVIGIGFLLEPAIHDAATNNTDLEFGLVDSPFADPAPENGRALLFNTQEASYLAGYVAAGTTKTGTVATFGGMNIPSVSIFMDGFVDGVAAYNEAKGADVKVLGWDKDAQEGSFAETFDDQAKGKAIAEGFISQGADIIMPVAGPVGLGAAAAAQAAGETYIIGVDADWYETAPDYSSIVLTSVIKEIGAAVKDTVKVGIDGNFTSEPYVGTIANGGLAIAPFHDLDSMVSDDVKSEVQALQDQIASGELVVESPSAN
ncbi:MAG: BMP family ABC transporter substrate-binding protein [Actinomycetaceae bacterium]|nr:BMP family ABC transporter substrate-binding protein [Arcanobacterium sp.]MDD7505825.1 BMP family ABC transporter substrate-binding protein [Actinomycetaceae bacterium]MDY6142864.1 BMP family ABC transporter substrate-binding protein [Arcanobacterium sp.]